MVRANRLEVPRGRGPSVSGVTNSALRESIRVDLAHITPWGGALRAIPVVALVTFGLGIGIGSPRTALTFGVI